MTMNHRIIMQLIAVKNSLISLIAKSSHFIIIFHMLSILSLGKKIAYWHF